MLRYASSLPPAFIADVELALHQGSPGMLALLDQESEPYSWHIAAQAALQAAKASLPPTFDANHAILFTGHRIDSPGRLVPRFPASAEAAAARAILHSLRSIRDANPGSTVGIAGGASGGDLLFHEACAELGIPTLLRLTLPQIAFLEASVTCSGPTWVKRFNALITRLGPDHIAVLGPSTELPTWITRRDHYDVWQRTNLWIVQEALALAPARTLLALWDGEPGDGPGGTGHLVQAAPAYGIAVAPILHPDTLTQQSGQSVFP